MHFYFCAYFVLHMVAVSHWRKYSLRSKKKTNIIKPLQASLIFALYLLLARQEFDFQKESSVATDAAKGDRETFNFSKQRHWKQDGSR
jgi:hypothetical protein